MASPQMQCRECRMWVPAPSQEAINTPKHEVKRRGADKAVHCSGSGRTPFATKGFKKPPPSIKDWP